jgi:hypothetical protein
MDYQPIEDSAGRWWWARADYPAAPGHARLPKTLFSRLAGGSPIGRTRSYDSEAEALADLAAALAPH